ncbi:MAG: hypothetical protein ACT4P6_20125 [Gemmatimonadaceae bacterium]
MRVLLRDLPTWMMEIIEPAIAAESRLELVRAPADVSSVREAVDFARPDVLVTGGGAPDKPNRGFAPLLVEFPTLRVFSIGGSGRESVEVMMVPMQTALDDISLEALVHLIARGSEGTVPQPQPTRHVPSD